MQGLITGGTGFLGTAIRTSIPADYLVLTRNPQSLTDINSLDQIDSDTKLDFIINLAGEPIATGRWSTIQKIALVESRINTTNAIVALVDRLVHKPKVIISGSAIGFYGYTTETCTENSHAQNIFVANLCQQWEHAIKPVVRQGTRLCILRIGVVLEKNHGMLKKLYTPFILGLGGKIGSGTQSISWIHIDDFVNIVREMLNNASMQGVYNCTAPNPVTNAEFTQIFAGVLHRPAILPLPSFIVNLAFGEMGKALLLNGARVVPKRLLDQNFKFAYPNLTGALQNLMQRK